MSWDNCKPCNPGTSRTFTSNLFKMLAALRSLQGTCQGVEGVKLEDIAMFMVKNYCLDGDVKSQVISTVRYAIKRNYILKVKDRFRLILPGAAIHNAPCKCRPVEIDRVESIFPSSWYMPCDDTRGGRRPRGSCKQICEEPCNRNTNRRYSHRHSSLDEEDDDDEHLRSSTSRCLDPDELQFNESMCQMGCAGGKAMDCNCSDLDRFMDGDGQMKRTRDGSESSDDAENGCMPCKKQKRCRRSSKKNLCDPCGQDNDDVFKDDEEMGMYRPKCQRCPKPKFSCRDLDDDDDDDNGSNCCM